MKRFTAASLTALCLAATALAAAGCASAPTLYQPATATTRVGYSEYRIEPGRYRITFQGGPGAPAEQVNDYALLRAADIALAEGYDWFRVSDRFIQGRADRGPQVSFGVGGASFGRRSGVGVGVSSGGMSLGGGASLAATIEVVMGKGERPHGADVYDARGVRENIGQRI